MPAQIFVSRKAKFEIFENSTPHPTINAPLARLRMNENPEELRASMQQVIVTRGMILIILYLNTHQISIDSNEQRNVPCSKGI
jgi:hypothetical protein